MFALRIPSAFFRRRRLGAQLAGAEKRVHLGTPHVSIPARGFVPSYCELLGHIRLWPRSGNCDWGTALFSSVFRQWRDRGIIPSLRRQLVSGFSSLQLGGSIRRPHGWHFGRGTWTRGGLRDFIPGKN